MYSLQYLRPCQVWRSEVIDVVVFEVFQYIVNKWKR